MPDNPEAPKLQPSPEGPDGNESPEQRAQRIVDDWWQEERAKRAREKERTDKELEETAEDVGETAVNGAEREDKEEEVAEEVGDKALEAAEVEVETEESELKPGQAIVVKIHGRQEHWRIVNEDNFYTGSGKIKIINEHGAFQVVTPEQIVNSGSKEETKAADGTDNDKEENSEPGEDDTKADEDHDEIRKRLREKDVPDHLIGEVETVLKSHTKTLIKAYLRDTAHVTERLNSTANTLSRSTPDLMLDQFKHLGLEEDKVGGVKKILMAMHEGKSSFSFNQLKEIGFFNQFGDLDETKLKSVTDILKSSRETLLTPLLDKLGFNEDKIKEILKTPAQDRDALVKNRLEKLGFDNTKAESILRVSHKEDDLSVSAPPSVPVTPPRRELTPGIVHEAELAHLRSEDVERALRAGYENPVEFLMQSRRNPNMRKMLQGLGYDLTPPEDKAIPKTEHPVGEQSSLGAKRRAETLEIISDMKNSKRRRELIRKLQGPGDLPFKLHKILLFGNILGSIKMKRLARRMYMHERDEHRRDVINGIRKKLEAEGLSGLELEAELHRRYADEDFGRTDNDGIFGRGRKGVKEKYEEIKTLDKDIRVQRSKLSLMNRRTLRKSTDAKQRAVAQLIQRDLESLEALHSKRLTTTPADFYDHEPYKKKLKEYETRHNVPAREADREELISLSKLGARNEQQQKRYNFLVEEFERYELENLEGMDSLSPEQQERLEELKTKYSQDEENEDHEYPLSPTPRGRRRRFRRRAAPGPIEPDPDYDWDWGRERFEGDTMPPPPHADDLRWDMPPPRPPGISDEEWEAEERFRERERQERLERERRAEPWFDLDDEAPGERSFGVPPPPRPRVPRPPMFDSEGLDPEIPEFSPPPRPDGMPPRPPLPRDVEENIEKIVASKKAQGYVRDNLAGLSQYLEASGNEITDNMDNLLHTSENEEERLLREIISRQLGHEITRDELRRMKISEVAARVGLNVLDLVPSWNKQVL